MQFNEHISHQKAIVSNAFTLNSRPYVYENGMIRCCNLVCPAAKSGLKRLRVIQATLIKKERLIPFPDIRHLHSVFLVVTSNTHRLVYDCVNFG